MSIRVRGKNGAALAPRARVRSLYEPEAVHPCRYRGPAGGRFAAVAHARLAARRYHTTRWLAEYVRHLIMVPVVRWDPVHPPDTLSRRYPARIRLGVREISGTKNPERPRILTGRQGRLGAPTPATVAYDDRPTHALPREPDLRCDWRRPSRFTTVYPVSLSRGVDCVDVDEASLLLASSCAASFHCAASISRSLRNTGSSVP